ncbi:ATP-binding cassette domain-containing protein [Collinsella ihumii]|uniref:UvrABC system protein A n=2 Tax=Actinomycetota TaxID=201174 RepID=A0ABT7XE73_9ACTN|nr:ATP-binding cassette domain-containing protein [Collinsella ihumii]MDN0063482.1 ATP-binding cassette domain-containing protein [Collinsella ihumii]
MKRSDHYLQPTHIQVRGARVHNLKNIDVDIPLGQLVGIAGVSGSGKSSLALGTLYAEGSRRYLNALSTYTRRRISQTGRATVDEVLHVPAALALRQRPGIPGVHSTFGTSTELLNYLRLMFSRLGSHACPHCGAHAEPSMNVALMLPITCPSCGREFFGPGAEDLAFNSGGACPTCGGTGVVRRVDESSLVPDESLSIDEGAVAPWNTLMWDLMKQVAREMGVRTDVPFSQLTPEERDIVFHGPAEKKHILYKAKKGDNFAELDFTYFNAVYTVENALAKAKDEKGLARVARFLKEEVCPDCRGTRLSERARGPVIDGMTLADATALTLDELATWVPGVPALMPEAMRPMAQTICDEMAEPMCRLQQLGLGYLSLDRASSTLSTGERQRVQLARAVRNRTCGVLYVLDEPSIGLHPSNVEGLLGVVDDLLADGNSVVLVDHDVRVLRHADHIVEIGPGSGAAGGRVIAQGAVDDIVASPATRIGPYLSGARRVSVRERAEGSNLFAYGRIHLDTDAIHTVKPLSVDIPRGRLTAVTGVSGSGKTTLVLESLIPALRAAIAGETLPAHVHGVEVDGIARANLIDATPIGANVRSTVGTYSGVLDDLRRAYAKTADARERGLKAGAFSYNTGSLRCPTCDGTGQISLDVQFLPDVDIPCPDCGGARYGREAYDIKLAGDISLPELLSYTVDQASEVLAETTLRTVKSKLRILHDLGLGYLTLGEATPALSGGEAQRLKLASELTRKQNDALFVFDEPTIGLHPLDVEVLLGVLQRLIDNGATVVVIEHDLDMIANADYIVDMGPGGGEGGGRIVCAGTPEEVAACPGSITGRYIAEELAR